jgi:hypothetical protein
MVHATRKWIAPFLAVLAVAAFQTPSAKAAFTLTILEDGIEIITINTGFSPINDSSNADTISVVTSALNPLLTFFQFTSLSATTSQPDGTPGSDDLASVTQGGNVVRTGDNTGGDTHTLTIIAREDNFTFPAGDPKTMKTTASDSYKFVTAGDQRTFQSLFDAGVPITTPLAALTFIPAPGPADSTNGSVVTNLGTQSVPFILQSTTVITLGPNGTGTDVKSDLFTGVTTVQAVPIPEPSSVALGLISLPALLALGRRMRRRLDV